MGAVMGFKVTDGRYFRVDVAEDRSDVAINRDGGLGGVGCCEEESGESWALKVHAYWLKGVDREVVGFR